MPGNWNVNKSKNACDECGAEFETGEAYFSALSETNDDADEPFLREDYCTECWGDRDRSGYFSYWKTIRQTEKKKPKVSIAVVFDFFQKLAESDQTDRREMRFVLALYLARRKALKFQKVKSQDDTDVLIFKKTGEDQTISVEDPDLTEEQIDVATERLKALFREEL